MSDTDDHLAWMEMCALSASIEWLRDPLKFGDRFRWRWWCGWVLLREWSSAIAGARNGAIHSCPRPRSTSISNSSLFVIPDAILIH